MDSRLSQQLLTACDKGLAGLVPLLLQKGASVNWTRPDGWTPLMSACSGGHLAVSQLLLDAGASVDAAGADGFTALMEACTAGHLDLVLLLLEHGASISHAAPSGQTAVILASLYGHTEVVELLLQKGADPKPNKFTALHAASGNGQAGVVRLLLRGAGPLGATPDLEAGEALISACANGHLEVARELLEHGVSPCVSAADGTTALMKACMGSHREVAAELILHGASVEEAFSSARRRKMPGVTRVLQRATEMAMAQQSADAGDLDLLVRSIEGDSKSSGPGSSRRRRTGGTCGTASTSTAVAQSETVDSAVPASREASPRRHRVTVDDSEGEDGEDAENMLFHPGCPLTGASWFKPLMRSQSSREPRDLQTEDAEKADSPGEVPFSSGSLAANPSNPSKEAKDCGADTSPAPEELAAIPIVPWRSVLEETAAHFPESTASCLEAGVSSVRTIPCWPCHGAFYTIEVLGEVEPPSPVSASGS